MTQLGQRLLAHVEQLATADSLPVQLVHSSDVDPEEDKAGGPIMGNAFAEETATPQAPLDRQPPKGDDPSPEEEEELEEDEDEAVDALSTPPPRPTTMDPLMPEIPPPTILPLPTTTPDSADPELWSPQLRLSMEGVGDVVATTEDMSRCCCCLFCPTMAAAAATPTPPRPPRSRVKPLLEPGRKRRQKKRLNLPPNSQADRTGKILIY
jgi:hypothetical protein